MEVDNSGNVTATAFKGSGADLTLAGYSKPSTTSPIEAIDSIKSAIGKLEKALDKPGPTGPTGAQGKQGPTGAQGPQGKQGPTGAKGSTGPQGPTGATGAQGKQGPTGAQGPQGPQGKQGPTGATGSQGKQGPTGATGTGKQGPTGAKGATGAKGPTGSSATVTKAKVESVLTGNITSHTHSYLPSSGGTITGSLTVNEKLYGPQVGSNPRNQYDSGLYFFNCDPNSTSSYNFGLYQ
jgi:hypothetical protein